jgi:hypothetical protein
MVWFNRKKSKLQKTVKRAFRDGYRKEFGEEPSKELIEESYQSWQATRANLKQGINGKGEYDWRLKERHEDYPFPDYDDVHVYCQVILDGGDSTLYYRTRNPELKVGDRVYVPVGYKYEKKLGTIVSRKDYVGKDAPYPLEKTKFIAGKA